MVAGSSQGTVGNPGEICSYQELRNGKRLRHRQQDAFFYADGGKTVRAILDPVNEPWRPEMERYRTAAELGVAQMWALQAKRTRLVTSYLSRTRTAGVDALLCPTTPYACVAHTKFKYVGYTGVFNVLDYSAASFPTGLAVDRDVDVAETEGSDTVLSPLDGETRRDCELCKFLFCAVFCSLSRGPRGQLTMRKNRRRRGGARHADQPAAGGRPAGGGKAARHVTQGPQCSTIVMVRIGGGEAQMQRIPCDALFAL